MASVAKRPAPLSKWFWFASLLGCTPGFKKSRCKKLLKVTLSRIKLLRGRREVQVRQLRRDVAQLLQLGQEENAESRLDRLWKEHSLLSAYIKTGEYCQLVKANLRNIAGQRECPMDLKESLASLCFAASCCADLPELKEIRDIMVMKYGKDFLTSAHELLPGEHVNRLFLDAFSTKQPLEVSKKALLKGILAEYNVEQPRKPKPPCIDVGSQKTAPSDCSISHKQQSRHECASNSESCKQHPNLNALEQDEKHNKSPKKIRNTTIMPTCGAFTEEDASLPRVGGDWERKMVVQHKKERKDFHFQADTVQGGPNETDLASQAGLLRALSHDRHGKEKSRNRLKASKRNARVNQVGQEDLHMSNNRMSIYEKTGPDEAASEFTYGLHGYGNTANEKSSLDKEVKGFVSGQHWVQEHGDFHGHSKHRENKPSNEEYLAETKQEVFIAQPSKHGYHDVSEDFNAHQMPQEGNHKKHVYVEREAHSRSNGKARSGRVRNAFDNVQHEREQCHTDSNHAETKSKHYSRSNRKDRFTNEFDNVQQERSPHRRNHHVEGGAQVDINDRFSETLRPGKVAYEIDNWQSPPTGYGILPEERELPHEDSNYGETHSKNNNRSNGKSRPNRELNNNQQERSPRRRNHHVDGETKIEINLTSDEKSRPGKVTYEIENSQSSPKGNGSWPDYVDTHKVQREKRHSSNKNHENAGPKALSRDHPNAHILQKGRKQHVRKHHFEETQQEAWADYGELVLPERATNQSSNSHICAHDNRYDSKYPPRQRDGNLLLTENQPTTAKIETCRDHKEARQGSLEPCMDGEHVPGDHGHGRQKHRRLARKHNSDHANSTLKVLDGDVEPKQERIAEETANGQMHWLGYTNGSFIPEGDSNYVGQRERAHSPQWHHQFDPKPKVCEGSIAVEARSLPQVHNAHGMQKEQNYPECLDEHEDLVAKLSSYERVKGNCSQSIFSKPPQRPPPPVPPYRVSSLTNLKPLNSPPALARCATLETGHVRANQEPHVHPKLPEYEDLVASFVALRNKPARPPTY